MSLKDTQVERLVHYQPLWGNWQVGKKIGSGSFGNVYLLHDYNEIEPDCVLKVITIEYDRNMRNYGYTKQSYLEYALNAKKEEIRIHARLSACPNIVSYQNHAVEKIYDENHELEGYDMLMRMEKLRALNDWQDDGNQLDEVGLIRLATHICCALRDGGKCGESQRGGRLVHRDIKPANIYVSKFGEFKLGDFGESRIDVTHSIMSYHGTPLYMAPEIYRHERSYHTNIDLYSLGIVLYEIANDGVMPFFDPSKGYEAMADALDERMSGTPVPKLTGVSAELAEIIAKAVEFDPRKRWQSAEDMLAALEQCGKRPQTAPETARTRPVDQTMPLDADELCRRAKAAYAGENYQEAVRLFRLSADAGNAEAMYMLGDCYCYGWGVDEDEAQAVVWYRKAAEAGNAHAMYRLGNCYYRGSGVDADDTLAVAWYRKAAEAGNAGAMYELGNCYYYGWGVDADYTQAAEWYQKAVKAGSAYGKLAESELNRMREKGLIGRKTQPLDADELLRRAKAAYTDKNYQEAVRLFRLSADAGNTEAMYQLGDCYYCGIGVGKDKAQAAVWYRKGADAGNAKAMYELGYCYQHGMGVDKDYTQAAKWYQKAVRAGGIYSELAKGKLNAMRKRGLI